MALALLGDVALAGCMISDQTGQMPQRLPGMGSGYSAPEDVAYHFDSGLHVSVPPADPMDIAWGTIDTLEVSGFEWQRAQVKPGFGPNPQAQKLHFTELPDWRTISLVLTDGRSLVLDVKRLSFVQRQSLLYSIVRYC